MPQDIYQIFLTSDVDLPLLSILVSKLILFFSAVLGVLCGFYKRQIERLL
jgi:hypothetical protein